MQPEPETRTDIYENGEVPIKVLNGMPGYINFIHLLDCRMTLPSICWMANHTSINKV
jgi:hypothetical protein